MGVRSLQMEAQCRLRLLSNSLRILRVHHRGLKLPSRLGRVAVAGIERGKLVVMIDDIER